MLAEILGLDSLIADRLVETKTLNQREVCAPPGLELSLVNNLFLTYDKGLWIIIKRAFLL